jgi:hypothetical protein
VVIGNPTVVPAGEWQTVSSTTTNVTLTDLTPETPYEAQVKSDCSDPEAWSSMITFTTPEQTNMTQTIALTQGVNWFSTYVEVTLDDLKAALVNALGTNASITIKSKNQNIKYNRGRWTGQLASLDLAKMYLIDVSSDCEITLEGMPIDPTTLTLTISEGVTYIAFATSQGMPVANLFGTFPANTDQVKSKTQNAKYNRGRWTGSLTTLEPGKGYIYVSSEASDRPFAFPAQP